MRHVGEQFALVAKVVDQAGVLQRRPGEGGEGAEQAEVLLREQRSHPPGIDVKDAELPATRADGRAQHRAQPQVEDAPPGAQLLATDDVCHRDHLTGAQHPLGDRPGNAQRRIRGGAAHRGHARLAARVLEEDETALGAREEKRLVESVLEQGLWVALSSQALRRLGEGLHMREGSALQRLDVLVQPLDLVQVGRRAQLLEDGAGTAQSGGGLHRLAAIEIEQAGDAVDAGQLQPGAGAFEHLARRAKGRGEGRRVATRTGCESENAPEIALLDLVPKLGRELERLRRARAPPRGVAHQQIELRQPPLGLEQFVPGADPAGDLHRLPIQRLGGRRISFAHGDLSEVAAHGRLDARMAAGPLDLRQGAGEQLARPRPVAALAVEEPEVVQGEQLLLERLLLLPAQLFPGLEGPIPLAREVPGDAEIVPGDRLLAPVAEGAVELDRTRRGPGGSVMRSPQPPGSAQPGQGVGLGAAVVAAPRDQERRPLLGDRSPSVARVPGTGAEQVVQPRCRLLVTPLARERQGGIGQLLGARVVAAHRLRARLDRGDGERIRAS